MTAITVTITETVAWNLSQSIFFRQTTLLKYASYNNNNNKNKNTFHGQNNITCSTNCKYRTAATLYTLETWFVSGIQS